MCKTTLVNILLLLAGMPLFSQSLSQEYRDPSLVLGQEVSTDATFYNFGKFHGRYTSSGERFDTLALTGAMFAYPFDGAKNDFKYYRVTRLENGAKTNRSVIVKINDKMPDRHSGIDLTYSAAAALDMLDAGRVAVVLERVTGPGAAPATPTTTPPVATPTVPGSPAPTTVPATQPQRPVSTPPLPRLAQTSGLALTYADQYVGMKTKSGEPYDANALTAGHRSLPVGTYVRVTRPDNQRSTVVRINDDGPRSRDRIIDLSHAAAGALDIPAARLVQVQLEVVPPGTSAGAPVATTLPTAPTPTPYGAGTGQVPRQGYGVQVAYSRTREGAEKLAAALRGQLTEPVLLNVKPNAATGQNEYRIVVGASPDYQGAVALRERLASGPYRDAFVVPLQRF